MQRQIVFTTVFATALAVSAAAQTGSGTASQERPQNQPITVTGCLQPAPSATGTSGTATSGTASSGQQFVLTNAMIGGASKPSTTGTAGAPGTSSAESKYKLMGQQDDLRKHVNAKVEIRGTLEPRSSAPGSTASAPASSDKDVPTLRVTSVRKIADTCSGN
jgi:hypothetical protein